MDDFYEMIWYLPYFHNGETDAEYMAYVSESFIQNYEIEKYQFALFAFHLLYISFVYFSVWQIKQARIEDFKKSLIGFSKDDENKIISANNPFGFWIINEARIFRFLKLIDCENEKIGKFAKPVQKRNDIAHPNGSIFFNDQKSIDDQISEMLKQVQDIQLCMIPIIHSCLENFLLSSWNDSEREYAVFQDQIEIVLLKRNYFSIKDIEICRTFDISKLSKDANYDKICDLFNNFMLLSENYIDEASV